MDTAINIQNMETIVKEMEIYMQSITYIFAVQHLKDEKMYQKKSYTILTHKMARDVVIQGYNPSDNIAGNFEM